MGLGESYIRRRAGPDSTYAVKQLRTLGTKYIGHSERQESYDEGGFLRYSSLLQSRHGKRKDDFGLENIFRKNAALAQISARHEIRRGDPARYLMNVVQMSRLDLI